MEKIFFLQNMLRKEIPKNSFLNHCIPIKTIKGEKRWKSLNGKRIYTWDSLHGEIEVFNQRGYHLGVLDINGNFIKQPVNGRKIDV